MTSQENLKDLIIDELGDNKIHRAIKNYDLHSLKKYITQTNIRKNNFLGKNPFDVLVENISKHSINYKNIKEMIEVIYNFTDIGRFKINIMNENVLELVHYFKYLENRKKCQLLLKDV